MKKFKIMFLAFVAFFTVCVSAKAVNVSNLEELDSAIKNGGDVVLTDDIIINTSDSQIIIAVDKVVNIDLNEHTLTANSTGVRKIINRGTLTITNGTLKNETSGAYGIIDSYGDLTIDSVVFKDYGQGDGSTVKIRQGNVSVNECEFYNEGVDSGNAGTYIDGTGSITKTIYQSKSTGAYPLIVNSGNVTITDVTLSGEKGGLGINSGTVVINSGTFTGNNFYGVWITNNNKNTAVTINGGTFTGIYGLYSSVDDGNQDDGDVTVTINGGTFNGTTKSAMAVNKKGSEKEWAMNILGGTFNSDISAYVDTTKSIIYTLNNGNQNRYVVVTDISVDVDDEKLGDKTSENTIEEILLDVINLSITDNELTGVSENLDREIKENLALGKLINSKIIINEIDNNDDLDKVKLPKNSKVAGYYDIELAVFADDEKIGTINELTKKIKIVLDLPENLPVLKKGYTRKYIITRIHDDKEEQLEATVDGDKISFESDKYSTFILSYVDTSNNTSNPNTLDNTYIYLIIGLLSLGFVGVLTYKLRKNA